MEAIETYNNYMIGKDNAERITASREWESMNNGNDNTDISEVVRQSNRSAEVKMDEHLVTKLLGLVDTETQTDFRRPGKKKVRLPMPASKLYNKFIFEPGTCDVTLSTYKTLPTFWNAMEREGYIESRTDFIPSKNPQGKLKVSKQIRANNELMRQVNQQRQLQRAKQKCKKIIRIKGEIKTKKSDDRDHSENVAEKTEQERKHENTAKFSMEESVAQANEEEHWQAKKHPQAEEIIENKLEDGRAEVNQDNKLVQKNKESSQEATPEVSMEERLRTRLLTVANSAALPMPTSLFYQTYILDQGDGCDVKESSYHTATNWLKAMECEQLVYLQKQRHSARNFRKNASSLAIVAIGEANVQYYLRNQCSKKVSVSLEKTAKPSDTAVAAKVPTANQNRKETNEEAGQPSLTPQEVDQQLSVALESVSLDRLPMDQSNFYQFCIRSQGLCDVRQSSYKTLSKWMKEIKKQGRVITKTKRTGNKNATIQVVVASGVTAARGGKLVQESHRKVKTALKHHLL